jgi:plastocyanin
MRGMAGEVAMRLCHVLSTSLCAPLVLACSGLSESPLGPDTGADGAPFDATVMDTGQAGPGDGKISRDVVPEGAALHDAAPRDGALEDATSARSTQSGPASDAGYDGAEASAGEASVASDSGGCASGYLACAAGCAPSDVHNCGTCGHDCTALPHVTGAVSCDPSGQCSFAPSACTPGWAHCSTVADNGCETDVTVPSHCGSCTTMCSGGTPLCAGSGSTRSCASACASGLMQCGTSCVDPTSDNSNCGGCGGAFACAGGKTCQSSQCKCQTGSSHDCSGTCMSNASTASCGGSCAACPSGPTNGSATCDGTSCGTACNSGYSPCNGACVNEQADNANCGGCGATFACTGGKTCQSSQCKCQAGSTHDCGGTCVNNTSTASCGTSCSACSPGPTNGYATCDGTSCGTACNSGFSPCAGGCVNEQIDNANCGGCGSAFACTAGKTCQSGVCTGGSPQTFTVHVAPNGAHVFNPSSVMIHVGDTVMWTWDFGGHTVTSGSSCTADNGFCSPNNASCSTGSTSGTQATYSHTFASAGTFPYFCVPHCGGGMTGSVVVQ